MVLYAKSNGITFPLVLNWERLKEIELPVWIYLEQHCFARCRTNGYKALIRLGPVEGGEVWQLVPNRELPVVYHVVLPERLDLAQP